MCSRYLETFFIVSNFKIKLTVVNDASYVYHAFLLHLLNCHLVFTALILSHQFFRMVLVRRYLLKNSASPIFLNMPILLFPLSFNIIRGKTKRNGLGDKNI